MAKEKENFSFGTDHELLTQMDTEFYAASEFKKPRIAEWHINEALLYGKKPATLSKRANIMINIAAGLQDSLLAKIKNAPSLVFEPTETGDTEDADLTTDIFKIDSSSNFADWEYKDLMAKKLAFVSGRAILKVSTGSTPYKHNLDIVDHYDFYSDPMTDGLDLETGQYHYQDFIFKSKSQLQSNKSYDQMSVASLIALGGDDMPSVDTLDDDKAHRFSVANMDQSRNAIQPAGMYRLREGYTTVKGTRCYVLYSPDHRIVIKKRTLKQMRPSNKYPYKSWAYYPDTFNYWSLGPLDLVRDIIMTRNAVINEIIDNNEAKNKPMKYFDPSAVLQPEKLLYRPDGLVPVAKGTDPSKAVFSPQTPDLYNPKEMDAILEDLTGKIIGISSASQGSEDEKQKVGIYYGNMQEIAGRMSLFEISYSRCFNGIGELWLEDAQDKLTTKQAIKMIGEKAVNWGKIDITKYGIIIKGGVTQAKNDAIKAKAKSDYIAGLMANPNLNGILNIKAALEYGAETAGFSEVQVDELLNPNVDDDIQLIRASQAIQNLLSGDAFRPFLKASPVYLQKVFDYLAETELEPEQEARFIDHLEEMKQIVLRTETHRAYGDAFQAGLTLEDPNNPTPGMDGQNLESLQVPGNQGGFTPPADNQAAGTMGATQAQAGVITNKLKETYQSNAQ